MSTTIAEPVKTIPAFSNEPVADFSKPANREAIEKALRDVRAQFGREYDLVIAGMLLIGLIGLGLDSGIRRLERLNSIRWGFSND